MQLHRLAATFATFLLGATAAQARLDLSAQPGYEEERFNEHLVAALAQLKDSPVKLFRELHAAVVAAPATIRIRRMSGDRAPWNKSGESQRGHTEPADGKPKQLGRTKPTDALAYVPVGAVEPGASFWKSGVLVHELTHALDLATGRYNPNVTVRERRATFVQNAWRDHVGAKLRPSYHGQFATLDYQDAKGRGALDEVARYLFARADFPPAPKATGRPERDDEQ